MFVYLSKKIAIPDNHKVRSLAWSCEHGFIACGGDDGLLKVLKLDSTDTEGGGKGRGLAAPRNLSMNQTLDGHQTPVQAVAWNEPYQKLTSSDLNGLIIVWMLYKGSWYEEMINNRNKSVVRGMAWTYDGHKICIVYDDGAIIVGSVDGNRMWGKELKGMKLSQVEWSPDSKLILIGVADVEVHVYDHQGNFINKLQLPVIQSYYGQNSRFSASNPPTHIVNIKWYNGINSNSESSFLAIAFENGKVQLMKNENDEIPKIIDSELTLTSICWNNQGTCLSITGRLESENDNKKNMVKFYSPNGDLMQVLKVPGKDICASTWEKEGLRVALAVDSYIFFANIRPDYKWCYFASTVVYSVDTHNNSASSNENHSNNAVYFWHTQSDTRFMKSVRNLTGIASSGQYCVLALRIDDTTNKKKIMSTLILSNSIGTPVDMINIEQSVHHVAMNNSRVIAASRDSFCVWRFKTPATQLLGINLLSRGTSAQRMSMSELGIGDASEDEKQTTTVFVSRNDPIVCICASEKSLIVAQESGCFQQYSLPNASMQHRFNINCNPVKIILNKDSSKLAILDINGTLIIYDFESLSESSGGKAIEFERKEVWDLKWASDNQDMIAVTEKTKMIVFNIKTLEPEDPVVSSGYICSFDDLTVKTVLLDELINESTQIEESGTYAIKISEFIIEYETKALKDARSLLEKLGISEAIKYMEQQSNSKLWRLLANSALSALDLEAAELAFVKCKDYKGIRFTKRIAKLQHDSLKRAEVYAFNGQFDEAEKLYLDIDRRDLAILMRQTLGDWNKVIELIKGDLMSMNDGHLRDAMCNLGDSLADNYRWQEAVVYYENSGAYDRLFECYCVLENYDGLKELVHKLSDSHNPMLIQLGCAFESVGMCKEACEAYLKGRKVDLAINCCVSMSEWKMAIDLASEYNVPNIDSLLSKYAQHLLAKERYFDIVELYRKANRVYDSATMLLKVIEDNKRDRKVNPLVFKKLYTLVGLLYEEQKMSPMKNEKKNNTLNALLYEDTFSNVAVNFKSLDEPWKGCEAYHFLLLCQRQLYEGYYDAAMKTALHLRDFDDFIDSEEIYCLLALASCANRSFSICSKAFIKLESDESITEEKRKVYEELAIAIFSKNPPKDSRNVSNKSECTYCETMISDWSTICPSCHTKFPICIASGRPIMDATQQWTCSRCAHHAHKADLITFSNCPLCHKSFKQEKTKTKLKN